MIFLVLSTVRRSLLNLFVILLWVLLMTELVFANEEAPSTNQNQTDGGETATNEESYQYQEVNPADVILYPSLILTLGVFVFYLLSRYFHYFPYTAVMFILGTFIGIGVDYGTGDNYIHKTVIDWQKINRYDGQGFHCLVN